MKKLFARPVKRTAKAPVVVEDWPVDETRPVLVEPEAVAAPASVVPDVVGAHEILSTLANSSHASLGGSVGQALIAAATKWLSEHELGDE